MGANYKAYFQANSFGTSLTILKTIFPICCLHCLLHQNISTQKLPTFVHFIIVSISLSVSENWSEILLLNI